MKFRSSARERETVRQAASNWTARRDAGLSPREEAEFAAWRDEDPAHAAAMVRYEALWSQLDRPRTSGAAPRLNSDLALLDAKAHRRRTRLTIASGAIALLMGVCWWGVRSQPVDSVPGPSPLAVILPEHRLLTDGTVVEYPAGAAIAVDFSSPDTRRVTLVRGEAHFQVAKNPARPFIVQANGVAVRAVGTAFSVQLASATVEVVVTEGRVAVEQTPARVASAREAEPTASGVAMLDAGQKLAMTTATAPSTPTPQIETLSPAEIEQRLAWRSPRMEFSNTPLQEVILAINSYAAERGGVQFTLGDRALGSIRLSGIFRVDDARAFLGILEQGFAIEGQRIGEQVVVLRRAP